jgi:hypothetical protein
MNSESVKIYSVENVPRLRYIAGLILGDILGLEWEVITDKRKLGKHPVINYSTEKINGAFKISPDAILFETGIMPKELIVDGWKGLPLFFHTSSDSDLPFDLFAASFFLVSRYEEYLEFQPDEHRRFPASSSLAFKNRFLDIPVIDLWVKEFSKAFLKKYQTLTFKRNEFNALLTIDTDLPFANHENNLLRSIGTLFHDMRINRGSRVNDDRSDNRTEHDAYDVFGYISEMIEKTRSDTRFFFPVGDHSKYDKNPSWKNENYRDLIKMLSGKFIAGLHPTYYVAGNFEKLNHEVGRLKKILGKDVSTSRFHYLRLLFPVSYRDIFKSGISEDYSMGYPDEPGFRAGIARPFWFYDLLEDHQTHLKIFPFQVMDETLINYKKLDPAASKEVIIKLIDETRKVGGLFISIWHNTSLTDDPGHYGWRDVFEVMLKNQAS